MLNIDHRAPQSKGNHDKTMSKKNKIRDGSSEGNAKAIYEVDLFLLSNGRRRIYSYWNWQSDQQIRKIEEKLSMGDFLIGQGNERGALEVYARVAETAPERIEPWVKMASVHAEAKRYVEEALPIL